VADALVPEVVLVLGVREARHAARLALAAEKLLCAYQQFGEQPERGLDIEVWLPREQLNRDIAQDAISLGLGVAESLLEHHRDVARQFVLEDAVVRHAASLCTCRIGHVVRPADGSIDEHGRLAAAAPQQCFTQAGRPETA